MEQGTLNFDNKVLFSLFDGKLWITETVFNTWLIMIFIIIMSLIINQKLKKFTDVPTTRFQNLVEMAIDTFDNFVVETVGKKYSFFSYWFFGVFVFILLSNYAGLIYLRPPTTDLATTAGLGIVSFLIIHISGIVLNTKAYFSEYMEPYPLFLPLNIIENLVKPISLSFRLFGNILGGFIILGMLYGLFPIFLKIGLPAPLHVYFDLFAGSLQAFIFTVLSLTFISQKLPHEGEH